MEFRPTDHASEKQLKLDVIAVYNHRLDEREKRKKFVIERNLLDYKKPPVGTKKRGRVSERTALCAVRCQCSAVHARVVFSSRRGNHRFGAFAISCRRSCCKVRKYTQSPLMEMVNSCRLQLFSCARVDLVRAKMLAGFLA